MIKVSDHIFYLSPITFFTHKKSTPSLSQKIKKISRLRPHQLSFDRALFSITIFTFSPNTPSQKSTSRQLSYSFRSSSFLNFLLFSKIRHPSKNLQKIKTKQKAQPQAHDQEKSQNHLHSTLTFSKTL